MSAKLIISNQQGFDLNQTIKNKLAGETDFAKRLAIIVDVLEDLFASKNPEYAALLLENLRIKTSRGKKLKRIKKLKNKKR